LNARKKRFLDDVLCVVVVAREPAGEVVGGIEVRQRDLLEAPGLHCVGQSISHASP
jgi:hypothetical protein